MSTKLETKQQINLIIKEIESYMEILANELSKLDERKATWTDVDTRVAEDCERSIIFYTRMIEKFNEALKAIGN